jgi:cytochrome b involved in lipid metabolism
MGNPAIFGAQASQPVASSFASANTTNSGLRKISRSELAQHNAMGSLWIGYKGHVYDATEYKHSGGLQAILRGGGKDATQMINRQHSWVKVDEILKSKRIGILEESEDDDD